MFEVPASGEWVVRALKDIPKGEVRFVSLLERVAQALTLMCVSQTDLGEPLRKSQFSGETKNVLILTRFSLDVCVLHNRVGHGPAVPLPVRHFAVYRRSHRGEIPSGACPCQVSAFPVHMSRGLS